MIEHRQCTSNILDVKKRFKLLKKNISSNDEKFIMKKGLIEVQGGTLGCKRFGTHTRVIFNRTGVPTSLQPSEPEKRKGKRVV